MNLDHLGDALDHCKGSLIRFLREKGDLANLRVLPMITDPDPGESWGEDSLELYARLLDVSKTDILKANVQFLANEKRQEYFGVDSCYDLFIDPDTGIGNEKPEKHEKGQREKSYCHLRLPALFPMLQIDCF